MMIEFIKIFDFPETSQCFTVQNLTKYLHCRSMLLPLQDATAVSTGPGPLAFYYTRLSHLYALH